jgi:hypothetical protein
MSEHAPNPGPDGNSLLLLDPAARAGRTGHRLTVKLAKELRAEARYWLGTTREDAPSVAELLHASKRISALLYDATQGDARLMLDLDGEMYPPAVALSTIASRGLV